MPSHRLDIQQIPLTLRPTLHPKIIPTLEDQQAEAGRLFSSLLGGIGGQVWQGEVCKSFGGTAVAGDTVYLPCTDGVRAVRVDDAGRASMRWHAPEQVTGSPVLGGGRLYAVDTDGGALVALDPATGRPRERVAVGPVSRFATPAIAGSRLYLPTLAGLAVIQTG